MLIHVSLHPLVVTAKIRLGKLKYTAPMTLQSAAVQHRYLPGSRRAFLFLASEAVSWWCHTGKVHVVPSYGSGAREAGRALAWHGAFMPNSFALEKQSLVRADHTAIDDVSPCFLHHAILRDRSICCPTALLVAPSCRSILIQQ